ncbi:TRAP transporter small permease [Rhizobacter sp. LjRoot28]|jgi:TRAP-type C4-dicarboxylate transport system permease small subunit|uniref:TRAP transporter small permease n=1 Tax=Rhizobacter sp. LjRoot28 TaxID=3342309 RepID=UPI003ED10BE2
MRGILDRLFSWACDLAAACVLAVFVLMIAASVGRMLGWRVGGINDIVAWLSAGAAFLAMAHAFKQGDFVRVTLMLEKLGPRSRRLFEMLSLSIAAVSSAYLTYWAAASTWDSYQFNDMAGGLVVIPLWIPQLSFVLGAFLLCLAILDEWVRVLQGLRPTYVALVEERHARGDFSNDV